MKKFCLLIFGALGCLAAGQGLKLPSQEALERIAEERGDFHRGGDPDLKIYQPGDFDPPPAGEVMKADCRFMGLSQDKIATLLAAAPDDESGKQSAWYAPLQAWKTGFDNFLISRTHADLFALIPTLVTYFERDHEALNLSRELNEVGGLMTGVSYYIVNAAGAHFTQNGGVLPPGEREDFVRFFSSPRLIDIKGWDDDEPIPMNIEGLIILDPAGVVAKLKELPWGHSEFVISGDETAGDFFRRYAPSGNGLPILKAKYAANKPAIDAKFVELKAWVDAQAEPE